MNVTVCLSFKVGQDARVAIGSHDRIGRIPTKMGTSRWTQSVCLIAGTLLFCSRMASAAPQGQLNLMPVPASAQGGSGSLRIDSSFSVALTGYTEPRLERAVQRFTRRLSRQTAIRLSAHLAPNRAATAKPTLVVQTDHASKEVQELGED